MNEELLKKLVEKMVEERNIENVKLKKKKAIEIEKMESLKEEIVDESKKLFRLIDIAHDITNKNTYRIGKFTIRSYGESLQDIANEHGMIVLVCVQGLSAIGRTIEQLTIDLADIKALKPLLEKAICEELIKQNKITEEMRRR